MIGIIATSYHTSQAYKIEDPVITVVMGVTGMGKSAFIKHTTGKEVVVEHGPESYKISEPIFLGKV